MTHLSADTLTRAIMGNLITLMHHLTRAPMPRLEVFDDPDLFQIFCDVPHPMVNGAVDIRLTSETADARIEQAIAGARQRGVPLMWQFGPEAQPADIAARLVAHGFFHAEDSPGMAVDLAALNADITPPPNFRMALALDDAALEIYADIVASVFELSADLRDLWVEIIANGDLLRHPELRWYLGYLDNAPVATSLGVVDGDVVGIYNVATLPAARHQGIGAAITLAPLLDARDRGCRVGILHASEMGLGLYLKLGFAEYCTISRYVWTGGDPA